MRNRSQRPVVGLIDEAPGVRSTMRLAVLVSVFSGCFAVVAAVFLILLEKQGPIVELVVTGGSLALSAEVMKALQKNIERRIEFGRQQDERRTVYSEEPEDGTDSSAE